MITLKWQGLLLRLIMRVSVYVISIQVYRNFESCHSGSIQDWPITDIDGVIREANLHTVSKLGDPRSMLLAY